jgi:hypothetical protein
MPDVDQNADDTLANRDTMVDRTLGRVAEVVTTCLQHKQTLSRTLEPMRAAQLRGEAVQTDLEQVFDRFPALRVVALFHRDDRLEPLLEAAVANDRLPEQAMSEFLGWWADKQWVSEGIQAHGESKFARSASAWDTTGLDVTPIEDELIVEHVMRKGVDEVHRLRAPAPAFIEHDVWRLQAVLEALADARADGAVTLDDEVQSGLAAARDELTTALELVDTLADDQGAANQAEAEESNDSIEALFNAVAAAGDPDEETLLKGFH